MRAYTRIVVGLLATSLIACTAAPPPSVKTVPSDSPTANTSNGWTLVGGGWSFGECGGWCVSHVVFAPDGSVTVTMSDRSSQRTRNYLGELTDAGKQQFATFSRSDVDRIERTYGCPDCTDGGASELTWKGEHSRFTTTYDYGSPPRVLMDQDRFVMQVIDTLQHRDSGGLVEFATASAG